MEKLLGKFKITFSCVVVVGGWEGGKGNHIIIYIYNYNYNYIYIYNYNYNNNIIYIYNFFRT